MGEEEVLGRMRAMLAAGTLRRIRQTLLSTSLAEGALIAWEIEEGFLEESYQWLLENDPFTGHIVLRECDDPHGAGAQYRLWTTLKVPTGYGSVEEHCRLLSPLIHAKDFVPLPVVGMFALSVGHIRREALQVGDKTPDLPQMQRPCSPQLSEREWGVLLQLKESLLTEELVSQPWAKRAAALGMSEEEFCSIAEGLDAKGVIGRFASFLNYHGKKMSGGGKRASGLFHWTVEAGSEERAGAECGRHQCMTHCYWRSGGERFAGAQIMGVVHAGSREAVLEHKAAIDAHLSQEGIKLLHTSVFWSLRAEIRPSEIRPDLYRAWQASMRKA